MKRLIFALLCAVYLASCSDTSENKEISSSEEVSAAETVATVTTVQTTQAATAEVTTTAAEVPFYFGDENEAPENAVYKQIRKSYRNGELANRDIFFYDEHDNVILILFQTNPESDKPSKIEYVYNYNADGTVSSKDMNVLAGNGRNEHTDYEYDSNGNLICEKQYKNDILQFTNDYTLDSEGRCILKTVDVKDCGIMSSTEYEYSEDGLVIKWNSSHYEMIEPEYGQSTYDENGNLKEEIDGSKKSCYSYDSDNRLVSSEVYYNDELTYTYEYEYEEFKK